MLPVVVAWLSGCFSPSPAEVQLIYGARGEGEIEPCGCPDNPRGGLARRAHILREHQKQGPLVVVDGGLSLGRLSKVSRLPGDLEQRRLKAEVIAQALSADQLDAMALGESDWYLGADWVQELVAEHELPVVAANLTCGGEAPYPASRVVEAGGKRIGIVGVTAGEIEGCEVSPAGEALRRAVAELGQVDVVVGLLPLQTPGELALLTGGEGPLGVDIAVDGRPRAVSAGADDRGGVQFVSAGTEGKALGVVSLRFSKPGADWIATDGLARVEADLERLQEQRTAVIGRMEGASAEDLPLLEDQKAAFDKAIGHAERDLQAAKAAVEANSFTLTQVDLGREVSSAPEIEQAVEDLKQRIAMAGGDDPRKFVPRAVAEGPYLGGEGCVTCHEPQHLQWSRTGHARAWQGLVTLNRALDHECWSCHVTGAGQAGGPQVPAENPGFRDVQCEACHGPGRAHAADPAAVDLVVDPGKELCVSCHDGVRDEGRFDYATYLPKVSHPNDAPNGDAPKP